LEDTREGSDLYRTTAYFSLKGKIEADKMAGKCRVETTSFVKSGSAIPNSAEILWIAERQ